MLLLDPPSVAMMIVKVVTMRNKRKKLQQNNKVQREMSILVLMKAHLKNSLIQKMKLKKPLKHLRRDLVPRVLLWIKHQQRLRTPSRFRRRC